MKYNFGCGPRRKEGFVNVDVQEWHGFTDVLWDLTKVPYEFVTEPVEEIIATELLEHISWRYTDIILKEWYRILKMGGKLTIQVPAIDKMCEMFAKGQICECVKHKPIGDDDAVGDKKCWDCRGEGKVNPTRWLMAFTGAQKHAWDRHLNVFTKEILEENLRRAGFSNIEIKYGKYEWKLIAVCVK